MNYLSLEPIWIKRMDRLQAYLLEQRSKFWLGRFMSETGGQAMAHRIQYCSRAGCHRRTLDRFCTYCTRAFDVEVLNADLKRQPGVPNVYANSAPDLKGNQAIAFALLPEAGMVSRATLLAGVTSKKGAIGRALNSLVKIGHATKEKRGRELFFGR